MRKLKIFLGIGLFVVGCFVALAKAQQEIAHPKWEYKIEFNIKEKKANELGAQGWELVAIGNSLSGTVTVEEYIFKRPK